MKKRNKSNKNLNIRKMKKQILIAGLLMVSAITFGQKKEIKIAQKAIKSGNFSEAISTLNGVEGLVSKSDSNVKEQYYLVKAEAYIGGADNNYEKINAAAVAYEKVLSLNKNSKYAAEAKIGLQETINTLLISAQLDQSSQKYLEGSKKIYRGYTLSKKDTIYLYYAASLAKDGQAYDDAIKYYEELIDVSYTGVKEEFYATKKGTKEESKFESVEERNLALKKGEYIIPRSKFSKSKKGTILKNMTFIYINNGENEKATLLMKKAREESPDDVSLMYAQAEMYYKSGDMINYKKIINEVIINDPTNPDLYYNLGVASTKNNEKEEALIYYTKAIELNPDYIEALINKAQLILDGESAIVEEMNALGTSNADYNKYDLLKKEKDNIYREALPYLESASKLRPESLDIVRTLIGIYVMLGMDEEENAMKVMMENNKGE
jgi:tetratricopeptide (TPR) repeat protein